MVEITAKTEQEPTGQPDLVVDWVRHGEATFTPEEMQAGDVSGKLTSIGSGQIEETAIQIAGDINKDNELVVVWSSPKDRAVESANKIISVLDQRGVTVVPLINKKVVERKYLRDLKTTQKGAAKLRELFQEQFGRNFEKWMEFYFNQPNLPEGIEKPDELRQRMIWTLTVLEKIARNIHLPNGQRLRIVITGHEEMARGILEEAFGIGTTAETKMRNAERMRLNFYRGETRGNARINVSFRDMNSSLLFDSNIPSFQKNE